MSFSYGAKVSKEDKEYLDSVITEYANRRGIKKGVALTRIVKDYFKELEPTDARDSISISEILQEVNCPYLKVLDEFQYACYEQMFKKKEPKILGLLTEANKVRDGCSSCKDRQVELHNERVDRELRKVNIKKLEAFMKNYTQISIDGKEVISHLCLGDGAESALIFSYDGLYLPCPLLKKKNEEGYEYKEVVNIETICKLKINPETRETPCEYLALIPHLITTKDIMGDELEPEFDAWIYDELPQLEELNMKHDNTIEADFKLLDKDLLDEDYQPEKEKEEGEE